MLQALLIIQCLKWCEVLSCTIDSLASLLTLAYKSKASMPSVLFLLFGISSKLMIVVAIGLCVWEEKREFVCFVLVLIVCVLSSSKEEALSEC